MAHFEEYQQPLTQQQQEEEMISNYHWLGATATGILVFSTMPISKIQSVLQTQNVNPYLLSQNMKFKGFSDCYDHIKYMNGFSSFFRGGMLGCFAGASYYYREHFLLMMEMKNIIPGKTSKKSLKGCLKYYVGTVSLYSAMAVLQYPFGVIIARLFNDIEPVPKYGSLYNLLCTVWNNEGFYNGFEWAIVDVLIEGVFRTLHHYLETDIPETAKWKYYALEYSMELLKYPFCTMCVRQQAGFDLRGNGETGVSGLYSAFGLQLIITNCTLLFAVGKYLVYGE